MTRLETLLMKHEGLRLKPYRCTAGKLTIGVGRNLDDVGITQDEAVMLLRHDIEICFYEANKYPWFSELNEARQAVIISMIFNLGAQGFAKFKQTISYIDSKQYDMAADQMLKSAWANQVGKRSQELSDIFRSGILP